VLFIAADVPWPPDGGGRIASLHVLTAFTRRAEVDLVAMADPFGELDLGRLRSICRRVEIIPEPFTFGRHRLRQGLVAARSVLSAEPYRLRKFRNRRLATTIARWKAESRYDLVHHEQFGVAQYVDRRLPSTALVQNAEFDIHRRARRSGRLVARAWASIEGRKLARREPALLSQFDGVFVLTEDDRATFRAAGLERVSVLPLPTRPISPSRLPTPDPVLLSLGSMSWFGVADGLRWFHDEVLPLVRVRVPGVRWDIVGPGAPASIQRFGDEAGITLHGYVDDIQPYVERARVAIVPLHVAGGIRIKLLDMMAWGLPSVTTTIGAQGLDFEDGAGAYRRDDPTAFADAIAKLIADNEAWRVTAERGRAYLENAHSPGAIDACLARGLDEAIQHHAQTVGAS